MHIVELELRNIGCIGQLKLSFDGGNAAGWHVILGGPGSGKTTAARAIALGLMGNRDTAQTVADPGSYLSHGAAEGLMDLQLVGDERCDGFEDAYDMRPEKGLFVKFLGNPHPLNRILLRREGAIVHYEPQGRAPIPLTTDMQPNEDFPNRLLFSHWLLTMRDFSSRGWFVGGFGPQRRFSGGNEAYDQLERRFYWAKSTVSLFHDDSDFLDVEQWLGWMHEQVADDIRDLALVLDLINDGDLLPVQVRVHSIAEKQVLLDLGGEVVDLRALSGEMGAVLTLVLELIRELVVVFCEAMVFKELEAGKCLIPVSGVVLIDDAEAGLSPQLQERLGPWLVQHFPGLQFIVTTAAEAVARSAKTVWRL